MYTQCTEITYVKPRSIKSMGMVIGSLYAARGIETNLDEEVELLDLVHPLILPRFRNKRTGGSAKARHRAFKFHRRTSNVFREIRRSGNAGSPNGKIRNTLPV
jgi:hypothetical protein